MKKILTAFLCLVLCLSGAVTVFAAPACLWDGADYLTDTQEAALAAQLEDIRTRQGLDVVIVTVPTLSGQDATDYADDYYDGNGYREDGILLLIADYDRQWAVSTSGYGITVLTEAGLDYLTEAFVPYLSQGDYSKAFQIFAGICDDLITQAKNGDPYDIDDLPKVPFQAVKSLLISLCIGLAAALLVTGIMRSQLKSVRSQPAASHYIKDGSMHITQSRELFLYRHVTRTKRETNSSSGGSKTHTSSSGRSHGGRSGRF